MTKAVISNRKFNISIKKMSCIIGTYNTNGHQYEKSYNWLESKKSY